MVSLPFRQSHVAFVIKFHFLAPLGGVSILLAWGFFCSLKQSVECKVVWVQYGIFGI